MRESLGDAPTRLRKLILHDGCTAVPGVFSPSVALLAAKVGFKGLYFSGAAFSGLLGLPDLGVTTLTEVADAVSQITSRVDLPMIVDVDTGFGEAVNMGRTVDTMERVGAAAIQVEDQVMPKRCGHLDGKQLVVGTLEAVDEMVLLVVVVEDVVGVVALEVVVAEDEEEDTDEEEVVEEVVELEEVVEVDDVVVVEEDVEEVVEFEEVVRVVLVEVVEEVEEELDELVIVVELEEVIEDDEEEVVLVGMSYENVVVPMLA